MHGSVRIYAIIGPGLSFGLCGVPLEINLRVDSILLGSIGMNTPYS